MTNHNDTISPRYSGFFEAFRDGRASGWAVKLTDLHGPISLHVLIDGQEVGKVSPSDERLDVDQAFNATSIKAGFSYTVPDKFLDGHLHTLAFRFPDRSIVLFNNPDKPKTYLEECQFSGEPLSEVNGYLDGVRQGALRGWIVERYIDQDWQGKCLIEISVDDFPIAQISADRYRPDVAVALESDGHCGFNWTIPQRYRGTTPHVFRVRHLPSRRELSGSPITSTVVNDELETQLVDLAHEIDDLHRSLTRLRRKVWETIPRPGFTLDDYANWAPLYYKNLTRRIAEHAQSHPLTASPLVSILCPVYKPRMDDFNAAVASVIEQTYANWELILIDDGKPSAQITRRMHALASADQRIRIVTNATNLGIAEATNAGLAVAKGDYIAFFDHDDALVDVALELMIRTALTTGAKLLYSDEDKVDELGRFQSPNFKPDFNYRYLLGCNYICHFTVVDAETASKVGPLRSLYNGAQDHDYLLRATEILTPDQIVHVPELLYHWRMTPNSTAVTLSNKGYATNAGVKAVADHLKRKKLPSSVSAINNLTIYRVNWRYRRVPSVTIIIPFKDEIAVTRKCIETLLDITHYQNYTIILVDNWSVSRQAMRFSEDIQQDPRIRVLRIEEEFNFSRINNVAAAQAMSDFYLFLNNDVFATHPGWLRLMVEECLAAPDVGAVGARLLYPNDTVQHAGVAVGPNVIGMHLHRGISRHDYGYIGRLALTHEVTAVTAAAMLVRRDVYHHVGGFDEENLRVAFNDVDLCLKIREQNYRIIYMADSILYHHESMTRGTDDTPRHESRFFSEAQFMQERWSGRPLFDHDPAFSRFFKVDAKPFFDLIDPEKT